MQIPVLRFSGSDSAKMMSTIFTENLHDLVEKVHMSNDEYEKGFFHTSTIKHPKTCYYDSIWARDSGRGLIELSRMGFSEQAEAAADYLMHHMNNGDHWGRTTSEYDSCRYEADGNALILLGLYNVWRMSSRKEELENAYLPLLIPVINWLDTEMKSNPYGYLLPCISELSGNPNTPYSVTAIFPNYALKTALYGLHEMAVHACSPIASQLTEMEQKLTAAISDCFVAGKHPSNTPEGCWLNGLDGRDGRPYEFSEWDFTSWPVWHWTRQLPFILQADAYGLTMRKDSHLPVHQKSYRHVLNYMQTGRLFRKYGFVSGSGWTGMGGRHDDSMCGYSQGFMTQAALLSDDVNTYSLLLEGIRRLAYDGEIVEDMADEMNPWVMHECFSYENYEEGLDHTFGTYCLNRPGIADNPGDEGNLVQEAEIIKAFRLVAGIDDSDPRILRIIPRLPWKWDGITAENFPFVAPDGTIGRLSFSMQHDRAGKTSSFHLHSSIPIAKAEVRVGPFPKHLRILSGQEYEIEQDTRASWIWLRNLQGTDIDETIFLW